MISRRDFVKNTALLSGGAIAAPTSLFTSSKMVKRDKLDTKTQAFKEHTEHTEPKQQDTEKQLAIRKTNQPQIITPNGTSLPFKIVDGVKTFHLTAHFNKHTFAPGLQANCWGYNGHTPGPTIEAYEGETVRIYVTNQLLEPTSIHWHGLFLPNGMDGVGGLNQPYIQPQETYRYEFKLRNAGTFMYHPHVDEMTQMAMGLMGMFIVHPKKPRPRVDRDFAIMLSEWKIPPGTETPDPMEMLDFNVLTMNGKAFPGTEPLVARTGQRIRIRFGNLSTMNNHPIHLHGYNFKITGTDGGETPKSAQAPHTTVLVPVGATRDIEFTANEPGDWAMHCHFTHHTMNQMGHDWQNVIGAKVDDIDKKLRKILPQYMTMGTQGMAGMGQMKMRQPTNSIPMRGMQGKHDYIDMGGMFTVLKVRDGLKSFEDPGWYEQPPKTCAEKVSKEELNQIKSFFSVKTE